MDEGTPEVGESSASSEAPIPVLPPQLSSTLSLPYKVSVMRRSLGHQGVHPYHNAVFQSIPQQVAGQPFQQWLALTRAACRFPAGDPLGVDVSIPNVVELDAGVVGMEHRSGSGIVGADVPVVAVPGCRLRLTHKCANRAVVQMANLGLDPVHAAEFHVADMLQQSRRLTGTNTPLHTPHPASHLINFGVRAVRSQIAANTSFNQTDLDHVNSAMDQLRTLVASQLIDDQGRSVEVFDSLGNIHPEFLRGDVGVDIMVGSGELSPESSVHDSDQGETFTFGNDGSD